MFHFLFLLAVTNTATAIIIVPEYQSLFISHYEDEPISLSHGATVNMLPGASVEIGTLAGSLGSINVLGGKIRNALGSGQFAEDYTLNVMAGILQD